MTIDDTARTPHRTGLTLHPIDPSDLEVIRRDHRDRFGHRVEEFVSHGDDQLRCCLRLSQDGERLWVIAHAPLTVLRPWREVGPVFVHAEPCRGYEPGSGFLRYLGTRPRVLRSYTADQAMYYARNCVTEAGDDLVQVLQGLFEDPAVAEVHLRNLEAQCFIARVTRTHAGH